MSVFRSKAFLIGGGLGLVGSGALGVLLATLLRETQPDVSALVVVAGAEASRHGAARIVTLVGDHPVVDQRCRGGCDDVKVGGGGSDNVASIRMLDATGACLSCDAAHYVTNGFTAEFRVGGVERPTVTMTYPSLPPS